MNDELEYWISRSKECARQLTILGCAMPLAARRNLENNYALACKKVVSLSNGVRLKRKYTG